MIKPTQVRIVALLLPFLFFQMGCAPEQTAEPSAKADMAAVRGALKKARKSRSADVRIVFLRSAYEGAKQLETQWPDSEKVVAFLDRHGDSLDRAPADVAELSMMSKDLEAFKWALSNSAQIDLQHAMLIRYWGLGKDWQEYFVSEYPDKTLSIFMNQAVKEYNVKFFNRHAADFKASGFRLEFPLEKTEFNSRYCRYIADLLERAMQKEDADRVGFLLDRMPAQRPGGYVDLKTEATMKQLGEYACYSLKDEAMACKLVELGYDMGWIHLATLDFKTDFIQALKAKPEYAVVDVLQLDEWQGGLSPEEADFLLALPAPALRRVHHLHINEAIETFVKNASTDAALRLIKLREETRPMTRYDYDQLLGWALESDNRAIFDYVREESGEFDIFSLDLAQLAGSQKLFEFYAPQILKKIYRTMEKEPKSDGTTFGRIHDLLVSNHPEAVFYIVRNYDFGTAWEEVTEGRTFLMDVCEGGNLNAAKYLVLKKGADVQAQTGYIELTVSIFGRSRSQEGRLSPIFFAAKSGNSKLIRFLASKMANVNARSSYGATPLMYAVDEGHLEAVQTLLALGAKVNATMNPNLTPTELAEIGRYEEVSTAYRRAKKAGNPEIIEVLKKAGARP